MTVEVMELELLESSWAGALVRVTAWISDRPACVLVRYRRNAGSLVGHCPGLEYAALAVVSDVRVQADVQQEHEETLAELAARDTGSNPVSFVLPASLRPA